MDDAQFDELSHQHGEVLRALDALDAVRGAADGGEDVVASLAGFLVVWDGVVEPHMAFEERELYPLLDRYLPSEAESAEPMLREHETLRALVAIVRRECGGLARGPEAEAQLFAAVQDLMALLREHIRKEEGVINPLLRRLLREGRHA